MRASKRVKTLGDLIGKTMTPVCRKRGFASVDIISLWPDIVGQRYGKRVQPQRLIWPRKTAEDERFAPEPATLVVHTDGPTAMMLSHEMQAVIERINRFYGWAAVGRIKIVQHPVRIVETPQKKTLRSLSEAEQKRLEISLDGVTNDRLQQALRKLGRQVLVRSQSDKQL